MPRTGGIVNFNTFVKGLITEASPLTFPENASSREENFELNRDGSRQRRLGLNIEDGYDVTNTATQEYINNSLVSSFLWENAGNTNSRHFVVVQAGQNLYFYRTDRSSLSAGRVAFEVDLEKWLAPAHTLVRLKNRSISITSVKGVLVITGEVIEPFYISYNSSTNVFNTSPIKIEIRDFIGIPEDGTANITHRPSGALTDKHNYNLLNQGWSTTNMVLTESALGVWPSNTDISHLAKTTTFDGGVANWDIDDIGTFKPEYLEREQFGTTPAPKGKFIFDVFNKSYVDITASTTQDIFSMSYDATANELSVQTNTAHGLVVGDNVTFNSIDIVVSYILQLQDRYKLFVSTIEETKILRNEEDTLSDQTYTVIEQPSTTTFVISWDFTSIDKLFPDGTGDLYTDQFGDVSSVTNLTLDSIGANSEAGILSQPISIVDPESEDNRPSVSSNYAGRVWYAGLNSAVYGSYIFYSQILENYTKIGRCYQDADPTSENISDLIDTDGGYITIPEAKSVQALIPIGQYLFVFSNNGVWRIYGDDESNFKATAYSVDKVSDVGVYSKNSIVIVENEVYYWSRGGIYKVHKPEGSSGYVSTNISETTIQTHLSQIGSSLQAFVKGEYSPITKKIYWLYNRDASETDTTYNYNTLLILDLVLGAYYIHKYPISKNGNNPFVADMLYTPGVVFEPSLDNVVVCSNNIVVGSLNVISSTPIASEIVSPLKYLTLYPSGSDYIITFSEYNDTDFLDFKYHDSIGTDAAGYMITGDDLQGSPANKKQAHYILMYFNRTETLIATGEADNPSGCLVNALWDWSTDLDSVRTGSQFQAYRLNRLWLHSTSISPDTYTYGEDVIVTKSKLRGRGRALSLAMQTEPGKDCQILGWSLLMSGGQRP